MSYNQSYPPVWIFSEMSCSVSISRAGKDKYIRSSKIHRYNRTRNFFELESSVSTELSETSAFANLVSFHGNTQINGWTVSNTNATCFQDSFSQINEGAAQIKESQTWFLQQSSATYDWGTAPADTYNDYYSANTTGVSLWYFQEIDPKLVAAVDKVSRNINKIMTFNKFVRYRRFDVIGATLSNTAIFGANTSVSFQAGQTTTDPVVIGAWSGNKLLYSLNTGTPYATCMMNRFIAEPGSTIREEQTWVMGTDLQMFSTV
jgi:hypothetical protein